MLPLLLAIHALAAGLWVGGLFFAFMVLRVTAPAEPEIRLALWARTLTRFFPFVWLFIVALLLTGYAMIGQGVPQTLAVRAMNGIGWLMFVLFGVLSLRLLPALKRSVAAGDLPAGAKTMAAMRPLMAINLVLGIVVIAIGTSAPYLR